MVGLRQHLVDIQVEKIVVYSSITAKTFYLKMGFKQFASPTKVGQFFGEYPLEKEVAI